MRCSSGTATRSACASSNHESSHLSRRRREANYRKNLKTPYLLMLKRLASPAWSMLEYGWYPLLVFLSTPYLLRTLGAEKFGLWMLLNATVGFGAFLNVGTGAATIKQVSAGRGRAGGGDIERVVRSSLAISLIGGGLLAALIFVVFWFAGDTFFEKMGDRSLVRLTGAVAALLAWIEQIDNVFASALKGAEQFGRAARIEMGSKTAQIFSTVLAVAVWESMTALYAALVLVAIARLIAKSWMVRRFLTLSSMRPSLANVGDTLHYAKWGWVQGVGGLLFGIADRLLVGSFLGAASLAHYSVASQLAQQIHALSAAGLSVLFPKVSRKLEGEANFSLWRITRLTMAGNFLVSSALALGLLIFGRKILSLWLGAAVAEASADVLWYLTIAYWILAMNIVPHFILLGLGRMRFIAISNFAAGVVLITTIYLLLPFHGLAGIGLARIAYGMVTLVNFVPLFWYVRGRSHSERGSP
jgi:O-antigen/teichoic acid export membrane protein